MARSRAALLRRWLVAQQQSSISRGPSLSAGHPPGSAPSAGAPLRPLRPWTTRLAPPATLLSTQVCRRLFSSFTSATAATAQPAASASAAAAPLVVVHPRHRGREDLAEALRLAESLTGCTCPAVEVGGARPRGARPGSGRGSGPATATAPGSRGTSFGSGTLKALAAHVEALAAGMVGSDAGQLVAHDGREGAHGGARGSSGDAAGGAGRRRRAAVFVNAVLSPLQERQIEAALRRRVVDRVGLITAVFASRAATREARLQVELAALSYQLPRLVRVQDARGGRGAFGVSPGGRLVLMPAAGWGSPGGGAAGEDDGGPAPRVVSARQRGSSSAGGLGGGGGSGDPELAAQRFRIRARMAVLRRQLAQVAAARHVQRQGRRAAGLPTLAIVGYTNVGKTSLAAALCPPGAGLPPPRDALFATLDPFVRRAWLPDLPRRRHQPAAQQQQQQQQQVQQQAGQRRPPVQAQVAVQPGQLHERREQAGQQSAAEPRAGAELEHPALDGAHAGVSDPRSGSPVAISDTVGFIRDLPLGLVAAFRATLEEVNAADALVHVLDASSPRVAAQRADVLAVLRSLGAPQHVLRHRTVEVWNKIDMLHPPAAAAASSAAPAGAVSVLLQPHGGAAGRAAQGQQSAGEAGEQQQQPQWEGAGHPTGLRGAALGLEEHAEVWGEEEEAGEEGQEEAGEEHQDEEGMADDDEAGAWWEDEGDGGTDTDADTDGGSRSGSDDASAGAAALGAAQPRGTSTLAPPPGQPPRAPPRRLFDNVPAIRGPADGGAVPSDGAAGGQPPGGGWGRRGCHSTCAAAAAPDSEHEDRLTAAAALVRSVHAADGTVPAAVVLAAVAQGEGVAEVKAAAAAVLATAGAGAAVSHGAGEPAGDEAAPDGAAAAGRWVTPALWLAAYVPWPPAASSPHMVTRDADLAQQPLGVSAAALPSLKQPPQEEGSATLPAPGDVGGPHAQPRGRSWHARAGAAAGEGAGKRPAGAPGPGRQDGGADEEELEELIRFLRRRPKRPRDE